MSTRFFSTLVVALLCAVAGAAGAQGAKGGVARSATLASCRVDSGAGWFTRQRAWMTEGERSWSDSAFRMALLALPAYRAANRGALLGFEIVDSADGVPLAPADSAMVARLLALGAQRGSTWPTRTVVGAEGTLAVWALAGRDTTLARVALKRMMEAGPDESPPAAVAILDDRGRMRAGRRQLYGTQLRRVTDARRRVTRDVEPFPIEDPAHLALRRDGAELPPLALSLCFARSAAARDAASRATGNH